MGKNEKEGLKIFSVTKRGNKNGGLKIRKGFRDYR